MDEPLQIFLAFVCTFLNIYGVMETCLLYLSRDERRAEHVKEF